MQQNRIETLQKRSRVVDTIINCPSLSSEEIIIIIIIIAVTDHIFLLQLSCSLLKKHNTSNTNVLQCSPNWSVLIAVLGAIYRVLLLGQQCKTFRAISLHHVVFEQNNIML